MTAFPRLSRMAIHLSMAVIGAVAVVFAVLTTDLRPLPALVLAAGAALLYAGLAGVIRARPRSERRANRVLRGEIDQLISLTRDLYQYRSQGDAAMIHETKADLRNALERIIKAASLYQEEPQEAGSPSVEQ